MKALFRLAPAQAAEYCAVLYYLPVGLLRPEDLIADLCRVLCVSGADRSAARAIAYGKRRRHDADRDIRDIGCPGDPPLEAAHSAIGINQNHHRLLAGDFCCEQHLLDAVQAAALVEAELDDPVFIFAVRSDRRRTTGIGERMHCLRLAAEQGAAKQRNEISFVHRAVSLGVSSVAADRATLPPGHADLAGFAIEPVIDQHLTLQNRTGPGDQLDRLNCHHRPDDTGQRAGHPGL